MFKSRFSLLGVVLLFSASASGQAHESNIKGREILSVLVKTDADRNIVGMDPSLRLTPAAQRVLRSNLEHHLESAGSDIPDYLPNSQFFADMAPVVTQTDGQNALHFELISTRPAPPFMKAWTTRSNLAGNGQIGPLVELPAPIPPTRSN